MATHVMLDLETFGVGNDAAIISIGAVKFDTTEILDRFHVGVNPESCESARLTFSASTLLWWLDQERDAARQRWWALEKVDLWLALAGFAEWYRTPPLAVSAAPPGPPAHAPGEELPIWGNGATFDNVILRSAYAACSMPYPAPFWADRCYRSVKALCPELKLERIGLHHSAVDDAESQARHLQAICAKLGLEL